MKERPARAPARAGARGTPSRPVALATRINAFPEAPAECHPCPRSGVAARYSTVPAPRPGLPRSNAFSLAAGTSAEGVRSSVPPGHDAYLLGSVIHNWD
ncbi:hypothetical protein AB0O28_31425, partial [Microbispora sp. NPDC088329]